MRTTRGDRWAIVLAAGEGTRMASLTEALHGRPLPKQFAALLGEKTFLQETMDRIAPYAPPSRTVVVIAPEHENVAREQLAGYPGVDVVVQPRNRGTGPGILLPLSHVIAEDTEADVAIFPSDHYVGRADRFVAAVEDALESARRSPAGVALVGAEAEHAATDLGWIVPGRSENALSAWRLVHAFVEKPNQEVARELHEGGALWNTFILAGRASAFWDLASRHIPLHAARFTHYVPRRKQRRTFQILESLYDDMPNADFSRHVLQQARGLGFSVMQGSGWSDCGTPERLLRVLEGTPQLERLRSRLQGLGAAA